MKKTTERFLRGYERVCVKHANTPYEKGLAVRKYHYRLNRLKKMKAKRESEIALVRAQTRPLAIAIADEYLCVRCKEIGTTDPCEFCNGFVRKI